jgi:hypothetical protein
MHPNLTFALLLLFSFKLSFCHFSPTFFLTSFLPWSSIRSCLSPSFHLIYFPFFFASCPPSLSLFFASFKTAPLTFLLCILDCYFRLFNLFFFQFIPYLCFTSGTYSYVNFFQFRQHTLSCYEIVRFVSDATQALAFTISQSVRHCSQSVSPCDYFTLSSHLFHYSTSLPVSFPNQALEHVSFS